MTEFSWIDLPFFSDPRSIHGSACESLSVSLGFDFWGCGEQAGDAKDEIREQEPDPDDLIMKMTLNLNERSPYASPHTYVFGFYRIDDRRVRVSIHQEDINGNAVTESVADFYISTFVV